MNMPTEAASRCDRALAAVGGWLAGNQAAIRRGQWAVVLAYATLLIIPAIIPLPDTTAVIWNDFTRFAQFVFWGIWWPGVILLTALFGRVWCGLLCPEGFLSETASGRGFGRAIPRWLRWSGWPTAAFLATTVYGQLTSVYQYPRPALFILGGSTLAAILTGYLYGRNKRVWCRYLCPVGGVFGLLAKMAPFQFEVNPAAWRQSQEKLEKPPAIHCAPMLPLRTMRGSSACHMCGRCNAFRGAIRLVFRSPSREIVDIAGLEPKPAETVLILFGLAGVAIACFQWNSSSAFASLRILMVQLALGLDMLEPLSTSLPLWILTNYPERNDVMLLIDAVALMLFVGGFAACIAAVLCMLVGAANVLAGGGVAGFHHLVQALLPVVSCALFTGLLALPVEQLRMDGVRLLFFDDLKLILSIGSVGWSGYLSFKIARQRKASLPRVIGSTGCLGMAAIVVAVASAGVLA